MKRVPDDKRRSLTARLPPALVKAFKAHAIKERRSVSAMIEIALEREIERGKSQP